MIIKHGGHFLDNFTGCAKVCGLFFLIVRFGLLIGWADELRSHDLCRCKKCSLPFQVSVTVYLILGIFNSQTAKV